MYQEREEGGKYYARDGYKVENREEYISGRRKGKSDTYVMDTRGEKRGM